MMNELSFLLDLVINEKLSKPVKDPLGIPDFFPVMRPLQPAQRVSSLTPL